MWIFQYFVCNNIKTVISERTTNKLHLREPNDGQWTSYSLFSNYVLNTDATDEVISETGLAINQFLQVDQISPP